MEVTRHTEGEWGNFYGDELGWSEPNFWMPLPDPPKEEEKFTVRPILGAPAAK